MSTRDSWKQAVRDSIDVPKHVQACANACRYDLMHGPSYMRIPWGNVENVDDDCLATYYADLENDCEPACGDVIEETYVGRVGDTLRAFISDLPYEVWVDTDCGCYLEHEPDAYEANPDCDPDDEDSGPEYWEVDMSSIFHLNHKDIIEALFGPTICREFS